MAAQYPFCGQEIPAPCEAATQRYSGSVNRHSQRLVLNGPLDATNACPAAAAAGVPTVQGSGGVTG